MSSHKCNTVGNTSKKAHNNLRKQSRLDFYHSDGVQLLQEHLSLCQQFPIRRKKPNRIKNIASTICHPRCFPSVQNKHQIWKLHHSLLFNKNGDQQFFRDECFQQETALGPADRERKPAFSFEILQGWRFKTRYEIC